MIYGAITQKMFNSIFALLLLILLLPIYLLVFLLLLFFRVGLFFSIKKELEKDLRFLIYLNIEQCVSIVMGH